MAKLKIDPKKIKVIPTKKVDGKKYFDGSRYPKIVTNGYEKDFKGQYAEIVGDMLLDIIDKMNKFTKT